MTQEVRKGSKEHRYNERGLEVREDAEGVPSLGKRGTPEALEPDRIRCKKKTLKDRHPISGNRMDMDCGVIR